MLVGRLLIAGRELGAADRDMDGFALRTVEVASERQHNHRRPPLDDDASWALDLHLYDVRVPVPVPISVHTEKVTGSISVSPTSFTVGHSLL